MLLNLRVIKLLDIVSFFFFKKIFSLDAFFLIKDVHQFDAHEIPFDGPTGIVARVERLLDSAPGLRVEEKQHLLDKFIRIILQQA